MSNKPKKSKIVWRQYITLFFFMLIGIVCGILMVTYMDSTSNAEATLGEYFMTLVALFIGMYALIMLQIIIHEAGHLIFGLLTGYKFVSFRIAGFMLIKQNGKLRFKRFSVAGTSGQCLMSPPEMAVDKAPVVLYNLGGSLMNLIAGFLFLFMYLPGGGRSLFSVIMLMMSVIGFLFAVMNGLPLRMGMVDNDGYNTLSIIKNPEARRAFLIQLKINEKNSEGVRIKDMPEDWFTVPSDESLNNSLIATLGVLACNRLMDEHRFEEADGLMEHMLISDTAIIGLHRYALICDRIYCELITQNRQDILDKMLDKQQKSFMKSMRKFPSVIRTEYAYALLAQKNHAEAGKMRAEFNSFSRTYPYPGDMESESELIEMARAKDSELLSS